VGAWQPFREANAAMDRLKKRYEIGIISNIDDKLLGVSRRHLRTELDLVVTAQQVRSYKPDPAHFKECARRVGGKKGWVHIGSGYAADIEPLLKMKVPVIWVNRHGEKLEGRKKPDAEAATLRAAAAKLGAK
jgi:2-haloacid dehalogenase/putative hydrolase of the HAD superfamily